MIEILTLISLFSDLIAICRFLKRCFELDNNASSDHTANNTINVHNNNIQIDCYLLNNNLIKFN